MQVSTQEALLGVHTANQDDLCTERKRVVGIWIDLGTVSHVDSDHAASRFLAEGAIGQRLSRQGGGHRHLEHIEPLGQ